MQAHRIGHERLKQAIVNDDASEGVSGHYSDGFTDIGSKAEKANLSILRSLESGLPDYFIERIREMRSRDDKSFSDFIGIFDTRFAQARINQKRKELLAACFDANGGELPDIFKLGGDLTQSYPGLLFYFLNKSRTLYGLRKIISLYLDCPVSITAQPEGKMRLAISMQTRLFGKKENRQNSQLGFNTVLGYNAECNRFIVHIICSFDKLSDLQEGFSEKNLFKTVDKLCVNYFRDDIKVNFFAKIPRRELAPPLVSRDQNITVRLGRYQCFTSAANGSEHVIIMIK